MRQKEHLNSDIQAIRAIAVISAILDHRSDFIRGGRDPLGGIGNYLHFWGGVDLFFVISGFLIAGQLLREIPLDRDPIVFSKVLIEFWIRRIFRIWPMAWFSVGFVLLGSTLYNRSTVWGPPEGNFRDGLSAIANVANFWAWQSYFSGSGPTGGGELVPMWSLALEEQFYIVIPFVILFLSRKWLLYFIVFACGAQFFLERTPHNLTWFLRTDAILLGVWIALSLQSFVRPIFEPSFLLYTGNYRYFIAGLLLLILHAVSVPGFVWFQTGIVAVLSFAIVWIASFGRDYLLPDSVFKHGLVWIGSRSYSMYVLHLPMSRLILETKYRLTGTIEWPKSQQIWVLIGALIFILLRLLQNA